MNSCQSPAQPARSRWGQSVGISQALSRNDQSVMSWSVFSRSSLQRNQPVRRRSVCTTTPVTSSGVSGPGWPSMRANWKPWVVWRGSKTSPGVPAATTWSIMPTCRGCAGEFDGGIEMVLRHVARGIEELAVDEGELGALRSEVAQRAASR